MRVECASEHSTAVAFANTEDSRRLARGHVVNPTVTNAKQTRAHLLFYWAAATECTEEEEQLVMGNW